ncbi:MAG: hypothetical protein JNK87_38810 [Bryobacterales bacterium]|nr:hypothetical protein [Bryobacterales bacterium]
MFVAVWLRLFLFGEVIAERLFGGGGEVDVAAVAAFVALVDGGVDFLHFG